MTLSSHRKWYSCHFPGCKNEYLDKQNLEGHLWSKHQIGKPFMCKCGRTFAYKNKFYVHRKTCSEQSTGEISQSSANNEVSVVVGNFDESVVSVRDVDEAVRAVFPMRDLNEEVAGVSVRDVDDARALDPIQDSDEADAKANTCVEDGGETLKHCFSTKC